MRYWAYPNPIQGARGCLLIPEGSLISDLPQNIQGRFGGAKLHRIIELVPGVKYAGLEVSEALRNIAQKGFHIAGVPIGTIEQWPGQPADA
jgi:hypothetical protein